MIISKETLSLIAAIKEPLLKKAGDVSDEIAYLFDDGIATYVEVQKDKFFYTKTFLFRTERVKFYDTYFPINLVKKFPESELVRETINIDDNPLKIFNSSKCISIIGIAGSGKSTVLKHAFLKSLSHYNLIPIVIELRDLNDFKGTITELIYDRILKLKLSPNSKILERILKEGKFLFLLDGYDEIYSENKRKITQEIDEFIDYYSDNLFLITSRPGANVESIPRFDSLFVKELSPVEIKAFIKKQMDLSETPSLGEKIIETVSKPESQMYGAYLSNPLLLSMFILTYEYYPALPRNKSTFYWNVFDTLTSRHDSITKKGGYQHERKTKLQQEDIETVLKWFGYVSLMNGRYSFDRNYVVATLLHIKSKLKFDFDIDALIYDLTVSLAIIVIDGLDFRFPHRSLQEYFAVLLVKDLPIELKKKIYYEEFGTKLGSFAFETNNTWDLCVEMDRNDFYESFILKKLEEFLDLLRSEVDIISRIIKYLSTTNYSQRIVVNAKTHAVLYISNWFSTDSWGHLLTYLKLPTLKHLSDEIIDNNFQTLMNSQSLQESEFDAEIDEYSGDVEEARLTLSVYTLYYDHIDNYAMDVFLKSGYAELLEQSMKRITEFIENERTRIKEEKSNTLDLLKFVDSNLF